MKFTLEIKLGNDAMREPADVADALRAISMYMRELPHADCQKSIRDRNGNRVGEWRYST